MRWWAHQVMEMMRWWPGDMYLSVVVPSEVENPDGGWWERDAVHHSSFQSMESAVEIC